MGQVGHNSNDFGRDGGKRPQRQAGFRNIAALATLLVAATCALSQSKTIAHKAVHKTSKHVVHAKSKSKKRLALYQGSAEASKHFDQQIAWQHLVNQVNFGPRVPGTIAHDKCEDYIMAEVKKYCEDVREQKFTYRWQKT